VRAHRTAVGYPNCAMNTTTLPPDDDGPDPPDRPGPNPDDNPGRRRGRPTRLTPELAEAVLSLLLDGNFRSTVCKALSLNPSTFRKWMAARKRYPDGVYGHFRRTVLAAEATAETDAVARIRAEGRGDARFLQWLLERKNPQRWGRSRDDLTDLKKEVKRMADVVGDLEREIDGMKEQEQAAAE
jgi:transposase